MTQKPNDDLDRPAYPCTGYPDSEASRNGAFTTFPQGGMTLREDAAIKLRVPTSGNPELDAMIRTSLRNEFAGQVQEDDRLVKAVRAMDDTALELFALHPDLERDEAMAEVDLTDYLSMPSQVAKVTRRLELEAKAIARVRFMQADAMLAESERKSEADETHDEQTRRLLVRIQQAAPAACELESCCDMTTAIERLLEFAWRAVQTDESEAQS